LSTFVQPTRQSKYQRYEERLAILSGQQGWLQGNQHDRIASSHLIIKCPLNL
jgi:hypothetical protein